MQFPRVFQKLFFATCIIMLGVVFSLYPMGDTAQADSEKVVHADTRMEEVERLGESGRYIEGEKILLELLPVYEEELGADHLKVANCLYFLGYGSVKQKKYATGEDYFEKAIAIRRKQLGPSHQELAKNLNNLGYVYRMEGKYTDAEKVTREALAMREKIFGTQAVETSTCLYNLGLILVKLGKYSEAETRFISALTIREKELGLEHKKTKDVKENLATLRRQHGDELKVAVAKKQTGTSTKKVKQQAAHKTASSKLYNSAQPKSSQGNMNELVGAFRENGHKIFCLLESYRQCFDISKDTCMQTLRPLSESCANTTEDEFTGVSDTEENQEKFVFGYTICTLKEHIVSFPDKDSAVIQDCISKLDFDGYDVVLGLGE